MAYEGGNRLKLSLSRNREYIDNDIQNIKFNINMNIQFDITYKNLKLLNPSGAGKTELWKLLVRSRQHGLVNLRGDDI